VTGPRAGGASEIEDEGWEAVERTLERFYASRERERIEQANRERADELLRRVIKANTRLRERFAVPDDELVD
jgi:hypothetical protein